jgi:hypothetical protein
MCDLAEWERQIGDEVHRRDHFDDRQLRDGGQCMGQEAQRCRTSPGPLQMDIFQVVFDELADAWRAVDMGDDLEQEVRLPAREAFTDARSAALCL